MKKFEIELVESVVSKLDEYIEVFGMELDLIGDIKYKVLDRNVYKDEVEGNDKIYLIEVECKESNLSEFIYGLLSWYEYRYEDKREVKDSGYKVSGYVEFEISDSDIRDMGNNMDEEEYSKFVEDIKNKRIGIMELLEMSLVYGSIVNKMVVERSE